MEIFTLPHLGTNWCFVDVVLFCQDETTGRLRLYHIFRDPIDRLYCRPSNGELRVVLAHGDVYDVIVNPAESPWLASLQLVSKGI